MLKKGQSITLESGERELQRSALVAGLDGFGQNDEGRLPGLGLSACRCLNVPPWAVYVPTRRDKVEVTADSDLELAGMQRAG